VDIVVSIIESGCRGKREDYLHHFKTVFQKAECKDTLYLCYQPSIFLRFTLKVLLSKTILQECRSCFKKRLQT
jgi:hypothetical protein